MKNILNFASSFLLAVQLKQAYLPCSRHIVQHLFHVSVLVPELTGPGQDGDCPVPHIARMIHLHTKQLNISPNRSRYMLTYKRTSVLYPVLGITKKGHNK